MPPLALIGAVIAPLSLVALLVALLVAYLRWNFDHWRRRRVPAPRPLLWHGNFPGARSGRCSLLEELHEIYLAYRGTHRYVGVYHARAPKLLILDPALAGEILTTHFGCFRNNESSLWSTPAVEQLRLCSPFVSVDDAWRERRAELTPALTAGRVRSCLPALQECAAKLVRHISERATHSPLDAKELARRYTAEFMGGFIWGVAANAFAPAEEASPIPRMAAAMVAQALACTRHFSRTAACPWWRHVRPVRFFPAAGEHFFRRLAVDALAWRPAPPAAQRRTVIEHLRLLRAKKSLSDVQIAGHTTTALIDGYETAALLVAHALLLLGREERVQDKLRRELRQSATLGAEALLTLPYLEQCVQETLRLFPPLATLFKLCTAPLTLRDSDGAELPLRVGDVVYISAYSFQRDARHHARPDAFWPERFDAARGGPRLLRERGVFLPFGDGPRMCPGMKLGLAEAKVAVAAIVRHFRLRCGPRTRTDNRIAADSFLLTSAGPIDIAFEPLADA